MVKERYKIKKHEWFNILKMLILIISFSTLIGLITYIIML